MRYGASGCVEMVIKYVLMPGTLRLPGLVDDYLVQAVLQMHEYCACMKLVPQPHWMVRVRACICGHGSERGRLMHWVWIRIWFKWYPGLIHTRKVCINFHANGMGHLACMRSLEAQRLPEGLAWLAVMQPAQRARTKGFTFSAASFGAPSGKLVPATNNNPTCVTCELK